MPTSYPAPKSGEGALGHPELSPSCPPPLPTAEPMFWEITRLRKEMSLAKLGFFPQEA